LKIKEKNLRLLNNGGFKFDFNSKITTCHACYSNISTNKLTAMSYLSKLDPGTIPDELLNLNPIEISCISRVKPYMKIMKMQNIYGQSSFKGYYIKCFKF
jgi:hypothetical protein